MPRALTDDQLRAAAVDVAIDGPILDASAVEQPESEAVAMRSPPLERLLARVVEQNDVLIGLLSRLVSFADPTLPAVAFQQNAEPIEQ